MEATSIETEVGNEILRALVKSEGWRVQSQYDENAFDKGIDFDSDIIEKDGNELSFEWINWFEWEITGDPIIIKQLSRHYGFKINYE